MAVIARERKRYAYYCYMASVTPIKKHLVVVGFDEIVANKYVSCIEEAIKLGYIDSYSVIDLVSQKHWIDKKVQTLKLQPEKIYYIPDPKKGDVWADPADFTSVFDIIRSQKGDIKVYIATELKAHEAYLEYCVKNNIDSLT